SFVPDSQGNLVNAAGFYLMGATYQNGVAPVISGSDTAGLQIINVNQMSTQGQASTLGTAAANLDFNAPFDPLLPIPAGDPVPAAYTSKMSIVAYGNVGQAVTLDVYLNKIAANQWDIAVYDRATGTQLDTNTFTFDVSATGKGALAGATTSLTVNVPGG